MKAIKTMPFLNKTFLGVLLINLFLAISVTTVSAHEQHPNILLNAQEIAAIKAKVNAGEEPWKSAYDKMIDQANSALNLPMMSVTYGGMGCGGSFSGTSRYYCPGTFGSGENNDDFWKGAWPIGAGVRDLGMAYAFTSDPKYAIHLIKLVKTWATDSTTGMFPQFSGNQSIINLTPSMSGLIYGVDLAWNYPGWDPADKLAFKSWVLSFGRKAVNAFGQADRNAASNNFENWRNAFLTVTGAFTGDQALLDTGYDKFRRAITWQVHCTGRMNQEYGRTERWAGRGYSLYAMHAMTITAEAARHQGVDLYNYATEVQYQDWTQDKQQTNCGNIRGLKTVLDYHAPFFSGAESWPNFIIAGTPLNSEHGMGIYELAYSFWQEDQYLDVVNEWGRPLGTNNWPLGVVTLTHANQFDLDLITIPVEPIAPNIQTQPVSLTVTEGADASFNVASAGSRPLTYQWYFNGAEIDGANSANYTLTAVSAADAGTYGCIVTNDQGSDSCVDATLEVLADAIAPTLMTASATSATAVDLLFSEAISPASAENSANYQFDQGIRIDAANLNADERTVSLTVSELAENTAYTVSVSNVQDQANTPNTIVELSSKTFIYRTADDFEDGVADGWSPLNPDRWKVVMDEGDRVYHLYAEFESLNSVLGEYSLLAADYSDFTFTAQIKLGDDVTSNPLADYAVVFGYQDPDNYYFVMFNNTQKNTQIFKVIDGTRTALVSTSTGLTSASSDWLSDNAYHSVEVSRAGNVITVRFDDNDILSVDDASLGAGKVGVGSFNDTAYFDDVSVTGTAPDDIAISSPTSLRLIRKTSP